MLVYVAGYPVEQLLRQAEGIPAEYYQIDLHLLLHQKLTESRNGNLQDRIFSVR